MKLAPITILHTNDMHGTLTHERFLRLEELREGSDLYFDTGDAIKTGNLGIPLKPEAVWPMLSKLRCTASVLGNRESHIVQAGFEAKIQGARHPILCANLHRRDGSRPYGEPLILDVKGIKIGLVGVMVPMVTPRMKTQIASVYLWDPPVKTALEQGEALRSKVDLLFALTHIGHRQDVELAEHGLFDVIFGGHSHTIIETPEQIGRTWIVQGGSHNRFAGVYRWQDGLSGRLVSLAPVSRS